MARIFHGPQNSDHATIFHVPEKDEGSNNSPLNESLIPVDQGPRIDVGWWEMIFSM